MEKKKGRRTCSGAEPASGPARSSAWSSEGGGQVSSRRDDRGGGACWADGARGKERERERREAEAGVLPMRLYPVPTRMPVVGRAALEEGPGGEGVRTECWG